MWPKGKRDGKRKKKDAKILKKMIFFWKNKTKRNGANKERETFLKEEKRQNDKSITESINDFWMKNYKHNG